MKDLKPFIDQFCAGWAVVEQIVNDIAHDKGWWDAERNDGECIALMHSELSAALEALREGNPESAKIPGYTSVTEELADVVIRAMDYAHQNKLNLAAAIVAKVEYNRQRAHRHGGKKF